MNLPFKINEREKRFLIIGGIVGAAIIIFHLFSWYSDLRSELKDFSDAKFYKLQKQLEKIAEKDELQKELKAVKQQLERHERAFLKENKPPVAAAELQKTLKDIASSLAIEVKLERTLNPVDADIYLGIPVEIGFTASTDKLQKLLYKLRISPLLLTVSEIKIRVTNISRPNDIYTTLVVTGFIRKSEEKEMDKEA